MTPVELPDDVPMRRLIPALVTKMSLPTLQAGNAIVYKLDHKSSGRRLGDDDTLVSAGVRQDDILTLLPEVTVGAPFQMEGIPGVNPRTVQDIPLQDLANSPAALVMVARQYELLAKEFNRQAVDLEIERQKSTDRLTATLLLLVSQVVLSLGTNLLTSNQVIPAIVVLVAGGLQGLLAIYLSFRKTKRQETQKGS